MTKKLSVSLPDDVAERLEGKPNVSAYVADALRARMNREISGELLAATGFVSTPEGRARARQRLDEARARRTPEALAELRRRLGSPRA